MFQSVSAAAAPLPRIASGHFESSRADARVLSAIRHRCHSKVFFELSCHVRIRLITHRISNLGHRQARLQQLPREMLEPAVADVCENALAGGLPESVLETAARKIHLAHHVGHHVGKFTCSWMNEIALATSVPGVSAASDDGRATTPSGSITISSTLRRRPCRSFSKPARWRLSARFHGTVGGKT
jgi:hypothetical protein